MAPAPVKMLVIAFVICAVGICFTSANPDNPNDIIKDALNSGGVSVPAGTDFKVKGLKGGSSSQSFPGGSTHGSSYSTGGALGGPQSSLWGVILVVFSSALMLSVGKV